FERKPSLFTLSSNNTGATVVTGSNTDIFKREGIEIKDGLVRSQVKMFNAGPTTPTTALCLLLTDCDELKLNYDNSNNVNENTSNICEVTTTVTNLTSIIKDEKYNEKSPSSGYGSLDFPVTQTNEKHQENVGNNEDCSSYKLRSDHDRNLYMNAELNKRLENSTIISSENEYHVNKPQSQQSFILPVTRFNSDKTSIIELSLATSKSNPKILKRPLSCNGYVQTTVTSSTISVNKNNRNKKVFDYVYRNQPIDYSLSATSGSKSDINVVQGRSHPLSKMRQHHLSML
ncbi:unnamed protein product, partial [Didymodactylos carnosus]